ncbi:MAG: SMC family ATPase [Clostridium sp.]|uniref:SMC family ATPase n=1 Tax=Clostridium sp. TaxID=1506 RepID=UPI003026CF67
MRPISLKIKGLNSFNEEQFIDFDKLTDRGFFGIFGPTGSGKSTVLDGITLALYGAVSRNSSNLINTNCDSLAVSFEFQISGAEVKRYRVDRELKRDKKTGSPKSGKCKLVDITSHEANVLADMVTEVNNTCKEIIGLSLDDFTRTVVLPQGKFSEFLKLEGKARREMLERLFNLQKYGDDLARKLGSEISREKTENSVLLGELKGYEDISEDKLKLKEEEHSDAKGNLNKATEDFKVIEKNYEEGEKLWNLQMELQGYKEEENKLRGRSEDVENHKKTVKLGEASAKVMPYIEAHEGTLKEIEASTEELSKLKLRHENLSNLKDSVQKSWNLWREKKDSELPVLKVKEAKVKDAIAEQKNLSLLQEEIDRLRVNIKAIEENEKKNQDDIKVMGSRILKGVDVVKEAEDKFEALKIDSGLKERVQQGIRASEKSNDLSVMVTNNKTKINKLEKEIEEGNTKEKLAIEDFNSKIQLLSTKKESLEELIKGCPGEQTDLLILQRKLSESKDKCKRYEEAFKESEESKEGIIKLETSITKNCKDKKELEIIIEELRAKVKEIQVETLAHSLREALNGGEVCPVCGSMEHHKENIKHVESIDESEIEKELLAKEKVLKQIEMDITRGETNLLTLQEKVKVRAGEIENLGEDFKNSSLEDLEKNFNTLSEELKKYAIHKEAIEVAINKLNQETVTLEGKINTIKSVVVENSKQLNEVSEEYKKNTLEFEESKKILLALKESTGVENFIEKNQEILKLEKEREELEINIKKYRNGLEKLTSDKELLQVGLNGVRENLAKERSSLVEKEKSREEKLIQIKNKVGEETNLIALLKAVEEEIVKIEAAFSKCEKDKVEIEEEFKICNEVLIKIMGKVSELEKRVIIEKANEENNLKLEGFETVEEVKKYNISKEKIKQLKEIVEEYNDNLSKLMGTMENLIKKIDNREITEEVWIKIKEDKTAKEVEIKSLNETKIKVEEEVNFIKRKLLELKGLLKKKEKLEHKLALLSDLEKLFKGKKFVEFVATTRLKYVSIEASKRLKEITSGNYGLEVDDNGKFIIRDYKNGGAERDATTLSGGETFLTSLALALALSAEIQLKGTAPLELFFLDEGFGTLDDNLLEVVMNSLEKIHNDKLKIGIISHVESIKNRVPVKLILTPAESGKGGSKVRIERS